MSDDRSAGRPPHVRPARHVHPLADDWLPWHARSGEIIASRRGGFHSDIWERKLSNGWTVGLSAEKFILPDGKVYEQVGLPPHQLMRFTGDVIENGRDEMLEAALAL